MSRIKRTIIKIEKRQTNIIRRGATSIRAICPVCGVSSEMLTAAEISVRIGATEREVFRLVEENAVHFLETGAGHLYVCAGSIENTNR